ncbi:MAG: TRAP transporter substrate-binding protein DctP [Salinisphaera sp.]|jgi:TRAP-type C4-dicarboxylate transport system substrate-binding protein|nr:TRAP transporter substrate-binding protein DctP [Salinisphaera sp.]
MPSNPSRSILRTLISATLIGVGTLGAVASATAADLNIRMAWYMPPHTAVDAQGNEVAQRIQSMSHGQIKVQTYPSGSLLKESNIGQGVANNTANMIISGMHWWSNQAPMLEWDTIPFLVDDASQLLTALHGPLGQDVNKEFNRFGVEIIGWSFYGYAKSYVNTQRTIKVPSDLKGLKMRSEGKLSALFLKRQGATPVAMDSSEVYTAMQRGTLDGGVSGLSSIVSRKWYEVGKHITAIHYVPLVYPIQVNRQWWMGLTSEQRDTIQKAVTSTESDAVARIEKEFKKDIAVAKKHGDQVYRPSKAELKQWQQATEALAKKNYLKDAGPDGPKFLEDVSKASSNN